MFKNLSIKNLLFGSVLFISVILVFNSYFIWSKLQSVDEIVIAKDEDIFPHYIQYLELKSDILAMHKAVFEILVTRDKEKNAKSVGLIKVENYKKEIDKILKTLMDSHIQLKEDDVVKELELFKKHTENFYSTLHKMANQFIQNGHEAGISILPQLDSTEDIINKQLNIWIKAQGKENLAVSEELRLDLNHILSLTIIGGILLFLVVLTIFYILNSKVVISLKKFQNGLLNFFKYLNKESNKIEQLDQSSSDEIGTMAKVINENIAKTEMGIEEERNIIQETIEVLNEFEKGDLSQRVHSKCSNSALRELTKLLNQMGSNLEQNISNVLEILEQYSNSNFIGRVKNQNLKEHVLRLANGVNTLGDAITKILIENKSNGLTLEASSNILLQNVKTLNINSNQAASALEETAAALEEITSTVQSTSNSVVKISEYAKALTSSSKKGEDMATQTNTAMDEINNEVMAINEAINIIDQIAFQTNILSLNAAVEAATAGEAGKGFAVVAQEVRNLASRSAEAAKDIKSLVENASNKANYGKQIADNMIDGYQDLNKDIAKTTQLIGEIANASKDQQLGIEQINDAVNGLDQKTQQNASIASQTNEVATQTDKIAKMVLENANAKEFIGKESVKVKEV